MGTSTAVWVDDPSPLCSIPAMANLNAKLSDIGLRPGLVAQLSQHGFERVADMIDMSNAEILRIPNMGGVCYRRLCAAMGREPHSKR